MHTSPQPSSHLPSIYVLPCTALHCTVLHTLRAELPESENVAGLDASAISARRSAPFLTLVALLAILDPPRDEAIEAVKVAHRAGIVVKMITGERRCREIRTVAVPFLSRDGSRTDI